MSKKNEIKELTAQRDEIQRQLDEALVAQASTGGFVTVEPNDAVNQAAAALAHEVGVLTGVVTDDGRGRGIRMEAANTAPCPIIEIPEAVQAFLNIPDPLREHGGVVVLVGTIPAP